MLVVLRLGAIANVLNKERSDVSLNCVHVPAKMVNKKSARDLVTAQLGLKRCCLGTVSCFTPVVCYETFYLALIRGIEPAIVRSFPNVRAL